MRPPAPVIPLRPSARRPPTTAFVLSGGASLGASQAGMLMALYERGIVADLLVGTSAGALNGAFVASRPQTVETAQRLARIWRGLQRYDVFPVSARGLVAGLRGQRDHLVDDRALRRLVRAHVEFEDLAGAARPLHVIAFDLNEHREFRLSAGPAVDAICASASIPGVLPPVPVGDHLLIDGGVANNTPISHAVELGAERVYVLSTRDLVRPVLRPPRSAVDLALRGLGMLVDARLEMDIARYSPEVELIVLSAPNPLQVQPSEFGQATRLIRDALDAARDVLSITTADRRFARAA